MSAAAIDFLTSVARAVSTLGLYEEGHPILSKAIDDTLESAVRLQEEVPTPEFTFVGSATVFQSRPLSALKRWGWSARLSAVGIQRLELTGPVILEDLETFLHQVMVRLSEEGSSQTEEGSSPTAARRARPTSIKFGIVGIKGHGRELEDEEERPAGGDVPYALREELDAVDWIHSELREQRGLHLVEAEAIVRSLSVAMHADNEYLVPLLRLKEFDQYTATHAINVCVLTMAMTEFIGLRPKEVTAFGLSGLLHDLGMVTIPEDIVNKPEKLTDPEREVMKRHPVAGARIIIEAEQNLDLAAVVAYEHHIRVDGGGYPSFGFRRTCHQASNLVHICDVFDALRTDRPYRAGWDTAQVLVRLNEGSGTEFDHELAQSFIRMILDREGKIVDVTDADNALLIGAG